MLRTFCGIATCWRGSGTPNLMRLFLDQGPHTDIITSQNRAKVLSSIFSGYFLWGIPNVSSQDDSVALQTCCDSKVTYAAVVWWSRTEVASTGTELQRLQRAACIMITGEMWKTPIKVMEMLLDFPTFNKEIEGGFNRCIPPTKTR